MQVTRRHTISTAHRLFEYNGRCERLHGHNYRIDISLTADSTNHLGMVIDFGDVKRVLCTALDAEWDHRTLLYDKDPLCLQLMELTGDGCVCPVPFNPTAENMAAYLATVLFPAELAKAGLDSVRISGVTVFETDGNSATWSPDHDGPAA